MLKLLRKDKVKMVLVATIIEVAIALVPDLEGSRVALMTAVGALFGALIGAHTLTDIVAISKLSQIKE